MIIHADMGLKYFFLKCVRLIVLAVVIVPSTNVQAQGKRLYIANDDHTDYMWSADEETYKKVMLNTLDKYLIQIDSTIKLNIPFKQQAKYNCDGSFWLWEYEKSRSAKEMANLVAKIKSGHLTVPLNPLAVLYGGMPAESSIRGLYYGGYLKKKYQIPIELAMSMESQAYPLGLSSLWAGSGVKYSWKGICGCATKMDMGDLQNRDNQVYFYKGLDGQQVLTKWYSLANTLTGCATAINESLGGYAEAGCLSADLIKRLMEKSAATKKNIVGAFGYGWDHVETYTGDFIAFAKSQTTPEHEVIVSNETDYFKDLLQTYGANFNKETVARGNEWDVYISSLAEVSAKIKRGLEKLRAAEALATLVSLKDRTYISDLASRRDSAWMSLGLYPEHDWTADGPVTRDARAAFERKLERNFNGYVDQLYQRSIEKLSAQISKTGKAKRFFVFNPLSWARTDFADFAIDDPSATRIIDIGTHHEVPAQVITRNGHSYLRILAAGIPPVGYKVYELQTGAAAKAMPAAVLHNQIFENGQFKLMITREGVITSLIDKAHYNQELVKLTDGRFFNDMGSGSEEAGEDLSLENIGPVSVTLKAVTKNKPARTTLITLFNPAISRVAIENTIRQNFSGVLTNSFSFNITDPTVWHEEVAAVIKAKLTSSGGHYATRNARYDWLTMNHFANIGNAACNVTLSNRDCYFMQLGNSKPAFLDQNSARINVLVGGQTDGPELGIKNQGGDSVFTQQFAISVNKGGFQQKTAMKASLEAQQPLITGEITGTQPVLPARSFQLLTVSNPDLILWALKPAEEGLTQNGMIVRFWNMGNDKKNSLVHFNIPLQSAKETTHIETDIRSVSVLKNSLFVQSGSQQMQTYRIRIK